MLNILVRWIIQCPDRFRSKCGLYDSSDIDACIPEYELKTGQIDSHNATLCKYKV